MSTRISCAVMNTRTAALKRFVSNPPSSRLNFMRFNDARLQAVLLMKTYSEQGLEEWIDLPAAIRRTAAWHATARFAGAHP